MGARVPALLLLIACLDAHAASFDCAKAASKVEKRICADAQLSELDASLAATYRQASALAEPGAAEPRQSQRAWLKRRNACVDNDCIAQAYQGRIAELADAIGQELSAEAIGGDYERRDAAFDRERTPASVSVRALADGRIAITGEAAWIGDADSGNVHVGSLEGEYELRAGVVEYRDGDDDWSCVLTLRFTRDALDIDEPRPTCGGANVSFAGHYARE